MLVYINGFEALPKENKEKSIGQQKIIGGTQILVTEIEMLNIVLL
jgi:hypothetical protein